MNTPICLCAECGHNPVPPYNGRGRRALYCSPDCRRKAEYSARRDARAEAKRQRALASLSVRQILASQMAGLDQDALEAFIAASEAAMIERRLGVVL